MIKQTRLEKPRFYREPSESDIESMGVLAAEINARTRARIVGSRAISATVAIGTGTAITAYELLWGGDIEIVNLLGYFGSPILINTVAELKIEGQLRHMGEELIRILPEIGQPTAEENSI